jgi:hypothetical protein
MAKIPKEDQYSDEEATRRTNEALRRADATARDQAITLREVPPASAAGWACVRSSPKSPFSFPVVDPRQQSLSSDLEELVGHHFRLEGLLLQPVVGPPPHAFWPAGKRRGHAWIAAEALPNLIRTP